MNNEVTPEQRAYKGKEIIVGSIEDGKDRRAIVKIVGCYPYGVRTSDHRTIRYAHLHIPSESQLAKVRREIIEYRAQVAKERAKRDEEHYNKTKGNPHWVIANTLVEYFAGKTPEDVKERFTFEELSQINNLVDEAEALYDRRKK